MKDILSSLQSQTKFLESVSTSKESHLLLQMTLWSPFTMDDIHLSSLQVYINMKDDVMRQITTPN